MSPVVDVCVKTLVLACVVVESCILGRSSFFMSWPVGYNPKLTVWTPGNKATGFTPGGALLSTPPGDLLAHTLRMFGLLCSSVVRRSIYMHTHCSCLSTLQSGCQTLPLEASATSPHRILKTPPGTTSAFR